MNGPFALTSLLFVFLSIGAGAQKFSSGNVKLLNGEVLNGLVKPPDDPYEKAIEFKTSEESEMIKYKSEEVQEVTVLLNDNEHRFVRMKTRQPKKQEPRTEADYRYSDPKWLAVLVEGHTTLYATGPMMKVKKDGRLQVKLNWNGRGVPPDIFFYLENESLIMPTWTALYSEATMGQMKIFKFWTTKYFADYPELVERIKAEEFKVSQIADVVTEYNNWKAGQ